MNLIQLLKFASEKGASDIHIASGAAPGLRIDGKIVRIKADILKSEDSRKICYSVLNDSQKAKFEQTKELDFSFEVKGVARYRANYYFSKNTVAGVFRQVPVRIPEFNELGLPSHVSALANLPNGLVLVTGPTGSGKTTTIASLINRVNKSKYGHIITLEDPIEYMHKHDKCMVSQREIGADSSSYHRALKSIVRQDPDYCLIGELRDLEAIEVALQLAETGHLVFSTLHTNSAIQTINRIVSVFPSEQQDRIRMILSFTLQAVVSQKLLPSKKGGRVLAYELLLMNSGVRNLIRENKLHQVETMMQVGQSKSGMLTLNQSLFNLYKAGHITKEAALQNSLDVDGLMNIFQKAGV
ncbi:MAG: type IV pilus twitching motility protein PilT [Bdellovibrionales bacterium]|nr:type IV pilus twitching motility protein PilT [Bdellovibrionales bacterium]